MKPFSITQCKPAADQPILIWDSEKERWSGILYFNDPVEQYMARHGLRYWLPLPPPSGLTGAAAMESGD